MRRLPVLLRQTRGCTLPKPEKSSRVESDRSAPKVQPMTDSGRQTHGDVYAIRGDLAIAGRLEPGAIIIERGNIAEILPDPRRGDLPEHVVEAAIVGPGLI